jgi:diaminopimelate decarboxylase
MHLPTFSLFMLTVCSGFNGGESFTPIHRLSMARPSQRTIRHATISKTDAPPDTSVFLTPESAKACVDLAGSPVFAYSLERLRSAADACLGFPNAYGLTVRYAMKACPNAAILKYFHSRGIHIDASSGYEVRRAMSAGVPAENISLSSQELPEDFIDLVKMGVKMNAW